MSLLVGSGLACGARPLPRSPRLQEAEAVEFEIPPGEKGPQAASVAKIP